MSSSGKKIGPITTRLWLKGSPAKVWRAVSTAAGSKRWYTTPKKLELKKGGRWDFVGFPGKVLEVKAGKKLVETHQFRPNEAPSRITFLVEKQGKATLLTVTHDGFGKKNKFTWQCWSGAWDFILCNLKTYVETGAPIWETCFKGSDEEDA